MLPAHIHASIDPSAVKRITRLSNASLALMLSELLQNCRRADATRVHITVAANPSTVADASYHITITDDGCGISDPACLLTFGANAWSDELVHREDAAGFGFGCLARSGCRITSRPKLPPDTEPYGWQMDLAPDHFLGNQPAAVAPTDDGPAPHGTSITFPCADMLDPIIHAIFAAALHYPLPVHLSVPEDLTAIDIPSPLRQQSYLKDAIHTETWKGISFGVYRIRSDAHHPHDANFLGHTVRIGLPLIHSIDHRTWHVRADIHACTDLELVLPHRNEPVQSPFLADLRTEARLAIYRAMAKEFNPQPTYRDWKAARDAGIDILEPPRTLRPWTANIADHYNRYVDRKTRDVPATGIIVNMADAAPFLEQPFANAYASASNPPLLFEPNPSLAGFPWYDAIPVAQAIAVTVAQGARTVPLDDLAGTYRRYDPTPPSLVDTAPSHLVDDIAFHLKNLADNATLLTIPGDVAFLDGGSLDPQDVRPIITRTSAITPDDLADLIHAAYYEPSEDSVADSPDTQSRYFQDLAHQLAMRLLVSEDDALRCSITAAIRRHVEHLAPSGRRIIVTLHHADVGVVLDAATPPAA